MALDAVFERFVHPCPLPVMARRLMQRALSPELAGNHLAARQKRLKPLRGFRGAALPGQSLVVYAPEWDLVVDR